MAGVMTTRMGPIPRAVRWRVLVGVFYYICIIIGPDHYGVSPFTIGVMPPPLDRSLLRLPPITLTQLDGGLLQRRRWRRYVPRQLSLMTATPTIATSDWSHIVRPKNVKEAHAILHQHVADSRQPPPQDEQQLPNNARIIPLQQPQQLIEIQGYIVKRRALGSSLVFLDLVMSTSTTEENDPNNNEEENVDIPSPIQALLRKDCHVGHWFEFHHKTIQPGTYVTLVGYGQPSRNPGETLLFISKATLNQPNSNPQHANAILQRLQDYHPSSSLKEQPNHAVELQQQDHDPHQQWSLLLQEVASAFRVDPTILWNKLQQTGSNTHKMNHTGTELLMGQNNTKKQQRRATGGRGGDSARHMTLAKELLGQLVVQLKVPLKDPSQLMGSSASKKVQLLPPSTEQIPHWMLHNNNNDSVPSILPIQEKMIQPQSVQTIMERASSAATAEADTDEMTNLNSDGASSRQSPVTVAAWVQNRRRFRDSVTVLEVVDDFAAVSHEGSTTKDSSSFRVDWTKRLKCILHPNVTFVNEHDNDEDDDDDNDDATNLAQNIQTKKSSVVDMYGTILCAGARVWMEGHVSGSGRSNFGESSLSSSSTNNGKQQPQGTVEGGAKDDLVTLWVTEVRLLRSSWRPKVVRSVLDCMYDGRMGLEEASQALELPGGYPEAIEISQYNETMLTER
eukprot:scaffold86274_cov53-Attheya_sp.AAC.7